MDLSPALTPYTAILNVNQNCKEQRRSVCVLLAAFNGQQWIGSQVDSILIQEGVDVHLFISVDLSTDDTYTLCKQYEERHANVHVLPYGESFSSAAKNFFHLIKSVNFDNFDYIALSDQDDIWSQNKLHRAISTLQREGCDAYSSDVTAFWKDGSTKLIRKSYPQKTMDYFFESSGPGCTFVLRRDVMTRFKIFLLLNWRDVNQVSLHDWMIYAFFRHYNLKWFIDNKSFMLYRQHMDNVVGANHGLSGLSKRARMIKSCWYIGEVYKIYQLVEPCSTFPFSTRFVIFNSFKLRRRTRDAVVLMLMAILGWLNASNLTKEADERDG